MQKLDFKLTTMNAMNCYIAEPYKVIMYNYRHNGSITIEKPTWFAYYRIYDRSSNKMLFGNSCEHTTNYESLFYDTKEEAMEVCQKHYENRINMGDLKA